MTSSAPGLATAAKSKLFAGLGESVLKDILCAAKVHRIAPKTNVTENGGRPDNMFLLQAGRVRSYILTESGSEVLLLWIVPGDIIVLVSLLANPPNYMASATTVTESEFLVWDHITIRRLAETYPLLTENGFRLALNYLGHFFKRHTNIVTKTAESRLAHALIQLATDAGEVQPSGVAIDITNEQLGSLSDISPFTASRLLSKWERDGMLSKQRGRVTLLAPESLMTAEVNE